MLQLYVREVGLGIRVGLSSIPVRGEDDAEGIKILSTLLGERGPAVPFELVSSPSDDSIDRVFK